MFVNICPCGGRLHESRHVVSTLRGLHAWDTTLTDAALPATIVQRECHACGRYDKRLHAAGAPAARA